jgi:L-Lysine epsilon oxidase N-terminal/L-lysine epsilon oxidase C-terminal domain
MPKTLEIHPAIGIARVGRSQKFFIGPEPDGQAPAKYRDENGELLRQAARFRVFECDRDQNGKLLAATEITTDRAQITWTVHLVNRKAAAPLFLFNSGVNQDLTKRRNNATGNDTTDASLIIDPGPRSVSAPGVTEKFDAGKFRGGLVPLGEMTMEPNGRLVVVGGFGTSDSRTPTGGHVNIGSFADNDSWFDDVGDGPVEATITFNDTGQTKTALAAWVIVAPPDFAPEVYNLITLYDVLYDLGVQRQILTAPATPFFNKDIAPILDRALGYQWVNRQARQGYDAPGPGGHGPGGPGDFSSVIAELNDPTTGEDLRKMVFSLLRNPEGASTAPKFLRMPRLNDSEDSGDVLPLTKTQYKIMQAWATSNFVKQSPASAEPELMPDALTRVALQSCSGGGFFPGIEAGRVMRDASKYMAKEPYRLAPDKIKPGQVTERNAVPWQADFFLCRWEEGAGSGLKRLGWWPAQRPDDVLLENNPNQPVPWARGLGNDFMSMVNKWHQLGIVVKQTNPDGSVVFFERERKLTP